MLNILLSNFRTMNIFEPTDFMNELTDQVTLRIWDVTSRFFFTVKPVDGYNSIDKVQFCKSYMYALILKINLTKFCHPKNVAKIICQLLMTLALTSHILTPFTGHIFEDNINTNVQNLTTMHCTELIDNTHNRKLYLWYSSEAQHCRLS